MKKNMKKTWNKPTITQLDLSKTAGNSNHNKTPGQRETNGGGFTKYRPATHVS